ncbi:MAG: hypothetical protein F6K47_19055 [Symploca sp. SIO2E6]|nr:hypothetical protein [Symploca sp. SIO2E6]
MIRKTIPKSLAILEIALAVDGDALVMKLIIGNWELGIGNWELGIGNWESRLSFFTLYSFPYFLLPTPCSLLPFSDHSVFMTQMERL